MSSKGLSCNNFSVRKHFVQCTKKSCGFFVLHYVTSSITKVANGYVVNGNIFMGKCIVCISVQYSLGTRVEKKLISNVINEADWFFCCCEKRS